MARAHLGNRAPARGAQWHPAKRDPRLIALSRDYYRALVLAARLKKAPAEGNYLAALQHELTAQFCAEIEPHFRMEEDLLLLALRALGRSAPQLIKRTRRRSLKR